MLVSLTLSARGQWSPQMALNTPTAPAECTLAPWYVPEWKPVTLTSPSTEQGEAPLVLEIHLLGKQHLSGCDRSLSLEWAAVPQKSLEASQGPIHRGSKNMKQWSYSYMSERYVCHHVINGTLTYMPHRHELCRHTCAIELHIMWTYVGTRITGTLSYRYTT